MTIQQEQRRWRINTAWGFVMMYGLIAWAAWDVRWVSVLGDVAPWKRLLGLVVFVILTGVASVIVEGLRIVFFDGELDQRDG